MDQPARRPERVIPRNAATTRPAPAAAPASTPAQSVFVASTEATERRSKRGWLIGLSLVALLAVGAVGVMIFWPRLKPRPRNLDAVETVAGQYLAALARQDEEAASKLGTVEEPPGIGSYRDVYHQKARDHQLKGSFAPLAKLHKKIDAEFTYDATAGRFTTKNALGLAGETLDALHAAKDEAEKSGMYKKMQSGDPNDIFDAAEQYGKVMENVSKNVLSPKRLLPTYKMLVESAKPPVTEPARSLAMTVAEDPRQWNAMLKRTFWSLKPDGPFIYEEAEVTATARERLGSLGDPPTKLRLKLVRFRLEVIDSGWKVVAARRVQPGDDKPATTPTTTPAAEPSPTEPKSYSTTPPPGGPVESPGALPGLLETPAPQ
jgi:hypothetical protein